MSITSNVGGAGSPLLYPNLAAFPSPGFLGATYVASDTGNSYIWTGAAYQVSTSPGSEPLSNQQLRADAVEVVSSNPSSIKSGQVKIATTGTAVSLGAATFVNGVVIKAAPSNAGNIFIGPSGVTTVSDGTGNGYILEAGDAIAYGASTIATVFINGAAGDFVYLTGN